jgi:acyl-CoA thioesterase
MTESEQQLAEQVVAAMMAKDTFSRWLGIEVIEVRPRGSTLRMTVRDDMLNGFGVCHGGVTFSFADSALAFASNTHGNVTMSIENGIRYPKGIALGDVLTAVADEESGSNRLGFYRVTVTRGENEIVALFTGTVYKTQKPFFSGIEGTE